MSDGASLTRADVGTLRIGTRGSALATTQTGHVAEELASLVDRSVSAVRIRTDGDVLTGSLAAMGGTGVFVTALRQAILDGRCDAAVHSLKDLPVAPLPGLTMIIPSREDPRDALCGRSGVGVETLPVGARVGTGSPRRGAQLLVLRGDLELVDIRGNVDTRLSRVLGPGADLDAVVLAYAGLSRLGLTGSAAQVLDPEVMTPAAGQGALALEVRSDLLSDPGVAAALAAIDDAPTRLAVIAERAILEALSAGCAAPVGAYASLHTVSTGALQGEGALQGGGSVREPLGTGLSGATLRLSAVVVALDGSAQLRRSGETVLSAESWEVDAAELARRALAGEPLRGAAEAAARDLGCRVAEELLAGGAAGIAPLGLTKDSAW